MSETLKVGVIGAGTVGSGVVQILRQNATVIREKAGVALQLVHVSDLRQEILAELDLEGIRTSQDGRELIADPEVQVVCELIGGIEPARTFILQAIEAGKHVVTANKMLLAKYGPELNEAAVRQGVELRFEASVGGVIPVIKALRESLASNHIQIVCGILNGTCNYILSRMTYENLEFGDVLALAQKLGYAETPPDLDVEGHDTAHKCAIVASLCYSTRVPLESVYVEGITAISRLDVAYAREMGYVIKLLAIIRRIDGEIEARVHPTLVPESHLLANVRNELNAVYVVSDCAGPTLYYGKGAGRMPTASAVVSDLMDIARKGQGAPVPPFRYVHNLPVRDIGLLQSRYYLRLTTEDHPGVLGRVCTALGRHGVSIASCIQKDTQVGEPVHVVMMTHDTVESSLAAAVSDINAMEFIAAPTRVIRIL